MTRAIFGNVGFEYDLAGVPHNKQIRKQEARFEAVLRLVPGYEDAVILTEPTEVEDVLVWGMSSRARAIAPVAARRWPPLDVVREVNDKRTCTRLAAELGCGLPGARVVSTIDEVLDGVRERPQVVKHPFGVAGRDQLHLFAVDTRTRDAVASLLRRAGEVVLEPRVEIATEFSGQFDCGAVATTVGFTRVLTDEAGRFRGNATNVEVPARARAAMERAAAWLVAAGYRGPAGIDGYVGWLDGEHVVVPLSEINARWTFGRLTLELARRVGAPVRWLHPAARATRAAPPRLPEHPEVGVWSLPHHCDPTGASRTMIAVLDPGAPHLN